MIDHLPWGTLRNVLVPAIDFVIFEVNCNFVKFEIKSLFGDCHEITSISLAFHDSHCSIKPVDSTMQKINPVSCVNLCR